MEYDVKGWHAFRFILTPEELTRVVEPFHLVVDNAHVPAGYRETPKAEFLEPYRQLYAKLARGQRLTRQGGLAPVPAHRPDHGSLPLPLWRSAPV